MKNALPLVLLLVGALAVAYLLAEIHGMHTDLAATNAKLDSIHRTLMQTTQRLRETNTRLAGTQGVLGTMRGQLSATNRQLHTTNVQLSGTRGALKRTNGTLSSMKNDIGTMTHKIVHAKLLF